MKDNTNTTTYYTYILPQEHEFLQQVFALGYKVGDEVAGRNLAAIDGLAKNIDWQGVLTEDNLEIAEYSHKTKSFSGEVHEDGLGWLAEQNHERNIYFHVNGGRNNASVDNWYAVFLECDSLSKAEQQEILNSFGLPFTVLLDSKRSIHAYLTVDSEYTHNIEDWKELQQRAAYAFGSDPAVKDSPRLMRAAGFDHLKASKDSGAFPGELTLDDYPCHIIKCNPDIINTPDEIKTELDNFGKKQGIQPYSEQRFKLYQLINGKHCRKNINYSHPEFTTDKARFLPDGALAEYTTRARNYTRLVEQQYKGIDCPDPATAWTEKLNVAKRRERTEYKPTLSRVTSPELRSLGSG